MAESEKSSAPAPSAPVWLAIVLSVVAIGSNGLALVETGRRLASAKEDEERARDFSIIKLYFDDFTREKFCEKPIEAQLFVNAATAYAPNLGRTLSENIGDRLKSCANVAKADAQVTSAQPGLNVATSYAVQSLAQPALETLAAAPTASAAGQTVYIQYKDAADAAVAVAAGLRGLVKSVPAAERVADVPAQNQIRIFKSDQKAIATQLLPKLQQLAGGPFKIVDLQAAYPKLPANQMEVWLADK